MRLILIKSIRRMPSVKCKAVTPSNEEAKAMLVHAIHHAKYLCAKDDIDEVECSVAWDTVDDIARGIHHREEVFDPLERYCVEHEEEDECRVYDV